MNSLFAIANARHDIAVYRRVSAAIAPRRHKEGGMARRHDTDAMFPMLLEVCARRRITWADLMSENRGTKDIAHARQEFMLMAARAGFSQPQIGTFLGRDASTVCDGIRAAEKREAQE